MCASVGNDTVSSVRVEIIDETEGQSDACVFPPGEGYVDLRENPHAVERIPAARNYMPLRNFLTAVNSAESVFASAAVSTDCRASQAYRVGDIAEFISRATLVFATPALNFDRDRYLELAEGLKQLLERDPKESVQGLFRILRCDFLDQSRPGFCLEIQVMARGESEKQAELRWGLALARLQQALLFRARALGQQIGA